MARALPNHNTIAGARGGVHIAQTLQALPRYVCQLRNDFDTIDVLHQLCQDRRLIPDPVPTRDTTVTSTSNRVVITATI